MGKTYESTLRTQGFRTHVVVGDETADFCCFCTKVVPKDVVPKDELQQ
jgi:very-short-patch-repair endonuclease